MKQFLYMLVMLISISCFGQTGTVDAAYWASSLTNSGPIYSYITNSYIVDPTVTDSQIEYAKIAWRKEHPYCAVCNYLPEEDQEANHVHHIVPVHIDRSKAASCFNFVTLCQRHHWWIAHCGTGWKTYNTNILQTIEAVRVAFSNTVGRAK